MKLPYKYYIKATGLSQYANNILDLKSYIIVENGKWPVKVIVGKKYYKNWPNIKSFWFGTWGIKTPIEFVDNDILEVL